MDFRTIEISDGKFKRYSASRAAEFLHGVIINYRDGICAVQILSPVDGKRRDALKRLFPKSKELLVFVTAFIDRSPMVRFLEN